MRNADVVTLKSDAYNVWIALLDSASGLRGRYTVYRLHRGADKRADIVGRELDLRTARKIVGEFEGGAAPSAPSLDCDWREAALKLAKCVVATVQTGGKIGMGTGMVMKVTNGKKTVERWDKDFVEALAFIGIEVIDKPKRGCSRGAKDA